MLAEEYNSEQMLAGRFTDAHIVTLVQFWQKAHWLDPDGYCGPQTQRSFPLQIHGSGESISPLGFLSLSVAQSEMGKGARELGKNNAGEFVSKYHRNDDPDKDLGSWCAAFISWCIEEACVNARIEMPFERSGGAKELYRRCGDAGGFVALPAPGDLACWDRGKPGSWQGHIGIVETVKVDENGHLVEFVTIEGNVGNFIRTGGAPVRRFTHRMYREKRLEGFARMPDSDIPVA